MALLAPEAKSLATVESNRGQPADHDELTVVISVVDGSSFVLLTS
jgi:hypothetical protein